MITTSLRGNVHVHITEFTPAAAARTKRFSTGVQDSSPINLIKTISYTIFLPLFMGKNRIQKSS